MKTTFTEGHRVHYNSPEGADAYIVRYDGEGFYLVSYLPDDQRYLVHEDDLAEGFRTERNTCDRHCEPEMDGHSEECIKGDKPQLSKQQWIEMYGGRALLDLEDFEVVRCLNCEDSICHGWKVVKKVAKEVESCFIGDEGGWLPRH
jgi:hypothetical protein